MLSRICLPSTAVLSNGFTLAIQSSFSSALTQGSMAGFISDIKNVHILIILELSMASGWFWILCRHLLLVHVFIALLGRMYRLAFSVWHFDSAGGPWTNFPIQLWSIFGVK